MYLSSIKKQKTKLVASCLGAILFFACQNDRVIRESRYPNGKLKTQIVEGKNKIKYFSYHESGSIESEGYVDQELRREGEWRYFDSAGSVIAAGVYNDDLRVGEWKYKTTDSSFSIYWEKYINRPVKFNIPQGWIIYENQEEPGLFLAVNDSVNTSLGMNISRTDKNEEPIDSLVARGNAYFDELYPQSSQYVSKAVINGRPAIKVLLAARTSDGKDLRTCRYYLEVDKHFYLLAFFSLQHDREKLYNKVADEITLSFRIIE